MFRFTIIYLCFAVAILSLSGLIGFNSAINPSARPVESHVLFWKDQKDVNQLSAFTADAGWITEAGLVSPLGGDLLIFLKRFQTAEERKAEWVSAWSTLALIMTLVGFVVLLLETALRWAFRSQHQHMALGSASGTGSAHEVRAT